MAQAHGCHSKGPRPIRVILDHSGHLESFTLRPREVVNPCRPCLACTTVSWQRLAYEKRPKATTAPSHPREKRSKSQILSQSLNSCRCLEGYARCIEVLGRGISRRDITSRASTPPSTLRTICLWLPERNRTWNIENETVESANLRGI